MVNDCSTCDHLHRSGIRDPDRVELHRS